MREARLSELRQRVDLLIAGFPQFLEYFLRKPAFRRPDQLNYHRETITVRLTAGSVSKALATPGFIPKLYDTLRAWGIGSRLSRLVPLPEFESALRRQEASIAALEAFSIDDPALSVAKASDRLWHLMSELDIVENKSKIVAGTKALHHLLPDLVVPIDRDYTRNFFGWHAPEFQNQQHECFALAFTEFVRVARATNPEQYVGQGWNTSRTKVIDNALVGVFVAGQQIRASQKSAG